MGKSFVQGGNGKLHNKYRIFLNAEFAETAKKIINYYA